MALNVKVAIDIFKQKWFRSLSADDKTLWLYLLTTSDMLGVFEIDSEIWNFNCKPSNEYSDEDCFTKFGNRIQRIPNVKTKGIIVGKLDYQRSYAHNSNQWKWIDEGLQALGLTYDKLQEMQQKEGAQLELGLDVTKPASPRKERKPRTVKEFVPPTLEEIQNYITEQGLKYVKAEAFYKHFTADPDHPETHWIKSNGEPVRNWKQTVQTWESKSAARNTQSPIRRPNAIAVTPQSVRNERGFQ